MDRNIGLVFLLRCGPKNRGRPKAEKASAEKVIRDIRCETRRKYSAANLNGVSRTYNEANQLIHDGTNSLTFDANGNMTSDGTNAHTWDRANRLLSMGGISYAYNGDGNRIQQDALKYILDLQPGLSQVIGDSDGNKFIYFPRGIHAVNDGADWTYPITDALGSVRGYVDASNNILSTVNYKPPAALTPPGAAG